MSGTAGVTQALRRRRATGPVLPEDLVVWEILVQLPAKTLLRCRAVCRSWRRRTSDPAFLLAHHRRQPSRPLVSFHGQLPATESSEHGHTVTVAVDASLDTLDLRRRERQPVLGFNDYNHHHYFCVHTSCDGLLLLSLGNHRYYLCNPATRQWASLPRLTGAYHPTLYPAHDSPGEYRVLYRERRHHVLTIGSSAEPRPVQTSVPTGWFFSGCDRPGVLLHGCLHWVLHGSEKLLVVFDTVAESFMSMPSPVASKMAARARLQPQLLLMGGTLAIAWIDESQTMMKLWVLQDYEAGVWTMKRRIILPVVEMRSIANDPRYRFYGTVVSEDGDVLLHHPGSFHLFHSDCKGELVQNFTWNRVFPAPAGHWFRERASSGITSSRGSTVLVPGGSHVSFEGSRTGGPGNGRIDAGDSVVQVRLLGDENQSSMDGTEE